MSTPPRGRNAEMQAAYVRQAVILRKNILEWDKTIHQGGLAAEDWPKSLGRLNAALNQTVNMDRSIDDVLEHFVYLPVKATANPQDVPFFLTTRLDDDAAAADADDDTDAAKGNVPEFSLNRTDPVDHLVRYEKEAAELAADYERQMVRF